MASITFQKHHTRVSIRKALGEKLDDHPEQARGLAVVYARLLMARMTLSELRHWESQLGKEGYPQAG